MSTPFAVQSSDRGLTYERRGSGPVVVLVHGWCLDRTVWMYLSHELVDRGFEVVAVDLAGYGDSRRLAGPFPLSRHGDDVAALLDELGVREVVVVGFAFGAAVLLNLSRYGRVGGIVSIGIPSAAGAPYLKMRKAMLRDWPLFASRSAGAICGREQSEAALAWLGGVFARTPLPSAIAGVEALAEFEPLEVTQAWDCPSLFVHGRQDAIVDSAVSIGAVSRFSGARLLLVGDSGHFVPWDQPSVLADSVIEFSRSVTE